ncbi:MAG: cytochrome c oxidase subunit II, partial [Allosphingosinicella sp.]
MKILHKLIAVAAAFGMAPVMAAAQAPSAPAAVAPTAQAAAPAAAPAAPQNGAQTGEAPANAQAAAPVWQSRQKPTPAIGQPDGRAALQDQVTPIGQEALGFHNHILMPIITVISLFVLALLLWVIVRYRRGANPVPSRNSHNTVLEIAWTLIPVLILVVIAVFSFRLLFEYHDMPKPYMTVKATGYQWYWGYTYEDTKIPEVISNILPEDKAKAKGVPYKLAATEPLVVPVNQVVRVQVTGADVIHAFAVPAFGIITDAVPGRLNETWFKVEKVGT